MGIEPAASAPPPPPPPRLKQLQHQGILRSAFPLSTLQICTPTVPACSTWFVHIYICHIVVVVAVLLIVNCLFVLFLFIFLLANVLFLTRHTDFELVLFLFFRRLSVAI